MHILDHEAPGLAAKLYGLEQDTKRAVLVRACLAAARELSNVDSDTSRLLEALQANGELTAEQALSAMVLSESADNRYFELKEKEPDNPEGSRLFSEARLLSAMAVGFGVAEGQDIADAVYELTHVSDDPSQIIRLIQSLLGKAT